MRIDPKGSPGEPTGINETGVIEMIPDHQISRADQRGNDSQIGHVAGGKKKGALGLFPLGQFGFQLFMQRGGSSKQSSGTGSSSKSGQGFLGGPNHLGMKMQSQIAVGSQMNEPSPIHLNPAAS